MSQMPPSPGLGGAGQGQWSGQPSAGGPYGGGPVGRKTPGVAIWGLVLSILSWFSCSILASIPGVICSHVALGRVKREPGMYEGRGLAIAGLVVGYANIAMSVLMVPLMIAILLPAIGAARSAAMEMVSMSNLNALGAACMTYAATNDDYLPHSFQQLEDAGLLDGMDPNVLVHPMDESGGPSYEFVIRPNTRMMDLTDHPSATLLIVEREDYMGRGRHGVYADGSVYEVPPGTP